MKDNFDIPRFKKKLYSVDKKKEKPFNFEEKIKLAFL